MMTGESDRLSVDLSQAVSSLAQALGLVGVDERQHGERVAYMAVRCAEQLGWDQSALSELFFAGLLHDCGVSSTRVHRRLITELDWAGSEDHCQTGARYLEDFPPLSHLAPVIRYHHTHWEQLNRLELPGDLASKANGIYLADRIDALMNQNPGAEELVAAQAVRDRIGSFGGSFFSPEWIEAFMAASASDAFWLNRRPLELTDFVREWERKGERRLTSQAELRALAGIFARIVDAKSPFTYRHSTGVARLAVHLSELLGLSAERRFQIELAGLLHDLGKLGVPDEILEKPGPLSHEETAVMHHHSYETFRILRRVDGLEAIAEWAGNHHETLLGSGYPFQRPSGQLSIESRLMMVSDIFQALAQDRPYRPGMEPEAILAILRQLVAEGKLDADLVELTARNLQSCWEAALEGELSAAGA